MITMHRYDGPSKAVAGAVVAGIVTTGAVLADGYEAFDLVRIAGAIAAGYFGVYIAPKNRHTERARIPRRRRRP